MLLSDKKYGSPRLSNEILDCSMPMTFDQYGNCGFYCLYCFSSFQRDIRGKVGSLKYAKRTEVKAVSVPAFKKIFSPEYKGVFKYIVQNRKPMQWGGLSDPFCPLEEKFGVGLEIMNFLADIQYPVSYSSKGDLLLRDDRYWQAMMKNKDNSHYKASIITLDEKVHPISKHYQEGGIGTYDERVEKKIADAKYLMLKYPGLFRYKIKSGCHPKAEIQIRQNNTRQINEWRREMFLKGKI
jgi:hypothetical protein